MSKYDRAVNKGMKFSEGQFSDTFVMDSISYQGVYNETTTYEDLQSGGFLERVVTTLLVRSSLLGNAPCKTFNNKEVFLKGRTWFVNSAKKSRNAYVFELGDQLH